MATLKTPITAADHIQGNMDAPVTLVEYGDYQCPYCGAAYPLIKRIQKHFGDKLKLVFRNFPLTEAHPYAEVAAETAEFANAHNKFWEMHDLLYENQDQLGPDLLIELAEKLKLSVDELKSSLQSHQYLDKIKTDFIGGVRSGVNGTPTFYINNQRYEGPYEYEAMVAAITEAGG